MKLGFCMVALSLGVAMAQETNPPAATQPTTPAANKDAKTNASGNAAWTPPTMPAEMKTMTFKGTLIDASCAAPTASGQPAASQGTAQAATAEGSANRSAGDCAVTANSSQFGMKLTDGRTMRFDMVGSQRAQDELKNNKRWSKDIAAGKPIRATVSGVVQGDKLIVSSIH